MSFDNFRRSNKTGNGLAARTTKELHDEVNLRLKSSNIFPLDIFHPQVKPLIEALVKYYDIPRSYVGLTLLSVYSTAIGTAYTVSTNGRDHFFLPIWSCLVGISSAGKSLAFDKIFSPILAIQDEYDRGWEELTTGMKKENIEHQDLHTVIYRDAYVPTLVRTIIPDNPKGMIKWSDEILEWINGMNQLGRKESIDEQFWISTWNCTPYSGIRSGKDKFVLRRPFVNLFGGIQYKVLPKLFARDRDSTGFIFRLLFACTDEDRIANPDPEYEIPEEWLEIHTKSINWLYKDLPVIDSTDIPKQCILLPEARHAFREWTGIKIRRINNLQELSEKEIQSGIFGKIKEYALRFAAILHLSDKVLTQGYVPGISFLDEEFISAGTMSRAIRAADYFFHSAFDVYERVNTTLIAPQEVLQVATLMRMGKPARDIAEIIWNKSDDAAKKRMNRQIKKWVMEYPRVFNAHAR